MGSWRDRYDDYESLNGEMSLKDWVVSKINVQLDVPFFDEEQEASAIAWCVGVVLDMLPESVIKLVSSDLTIGSEAADSLADVIANMVSSKMNHPQIPDFIEKPMIEMIVRTVVDALMRMAQSKLSED